MYYVYHIYLEIESFDDVATSLGRLVYPERYRAPQAGARHGLKAPHGTRCTKVPDTASNAMHHSLLPPPSSLLL